MGARGKPESIPEVRLNARAVSRGIAVGTVVCLHGTGRQFYRIDLAPSEVPRELKRLRTALSVAKRQLSKIVNRKAVRLANSGPGIFEAHRVLIEDPHLQSRFEEEITSHHVNAEWAIKTVTELYVAKYKALKDEHLRDRYIDIEDVADRILGGLGNGPGLTLPFERNSVIVAKELKPSTLVELADSYPKAFITENGGWTSHSFILAREMKCPAVTGVKKVLRRVKTGDRVIVDGYNGQIILNPTEETQARYSAAASRFAGHDNGTTRTSPVPVKTLDGKVICILANADSPAAYTRAAEQGAEGIGLFRSEFLFNRFRGFPTENEQMAAYREIAEAAGNHGVKIRTFDLGVDQLQDQNAAREKNPALGLRAVRLGLTYKKVLRTQIRALLRASHGKKIDIVIPMVSGVSEIREVKEMIAHESELFASKGKKIGSPRIGAMIEVPSAVLMIDELVRETDFLCLGTNDLIQYLLAADRDNETVADWYRTLHPGVLRAVRQVIVSAAAAGKPAIICGEMAGSPYYVPILIGLGATDLSMNAASIRRTRKIVSGIAYEEAHRIVKSIESCPTVEEIEKEINHLIKKNWLHLFSKDFSFK